MPSLKKFLSRFYDACILGPQMRLIGASMLFRVHRRMGIGNYETAQASGESFMLGRILPELLGSGDAVLLDVGANVGNYTRSLVERFPKSRIYSFEPVPATYSALVSNIKAGNVQCVPVGLSESVGTATMYDYGGQPGSEHSSLYAEVLTELHHASKVKSFEIKLETLDGFCRGAGIDRIDFLKIDTEGNELAVLKGAAGLLERKSIGLIQFEFNEMNLVSRVSLRDFYSRLPGFSFYRLHAKGLLPLGPYDIRNEIYVFQNILAVRNELYSADRLRKFIVKAG